MTREVRLEPEARAELREAMLWYDEQRPGLGEEFVSEIGATIEAISGRSESFPRVLGALGVRRALVHRFPYAVVFLVAQDLLIVLAVAHGKRRPLYWRARKPRP